MFKKITSYLGECRCGLCGCVFLPASVSMAEPLCKKKRIIWVRVAAVCERACVFFPVRVSMAELLCLRASVAAVCARARSCLFLLALVSIAELICLKTCLDVHCVSVCFNL